MLWLPKALSGVTFRKSALAPSLRADRRMTQLRGCLDRQVGGPVVRDRRFACHETRLLRIERRHGMNALFAYRGERLVQCVKDVISANNVAQARHNATNSSFNRSTILPTAALAT